MCSAGFALLLPYHLLHLFLQLSVFKVPDNSDEDHDSALLPGVLFLLITYYCLFMSFWCLISFSLLIFTFTFAWLHLNGSMTPEYLLHDPVVALRYVPPDQAKVVASVHASMSGSSASSTSSTPEVRPLKTLLGDSAPALHLSRNTPSQVPTHTSGIYPIPAYGFYTNRNAEL